MNKKLNMVISAQLLAVAGVLAIASPGYSQNFGDFLRNTFGNNSDSQQRHHNLNATMNQTMNSYNSKRVDLDNQISVALANNQITQQQSNDWRAQISVNSNLQNSATSDGNFTFLEAQNVLDRLSTIENEFNTVVNLSTTNKYSQRSNWSNKRNNNYPGSRNSRKDYWNNQNNVDLTQKKILSRLEQGRTDRRLSYREYSNLKSQYDRIVGREAADRNSRGRLSSQERSDLLNRLNNLNNSITQHLNNRRISGR